MNQSESMPKNQEDLKTSCRAGEQASEESRSRFSKNTKVPTLHKFYILILSLVLSCLSIALPVFTDLANSLQSQNLYTGLMLTKGQVPFSDSFATGGFLYYILIALSYLFGTSLWLVLIQFILFYLSGIYFYKLVNYFTNNQQIAATFNFIFYFLNFALGFGGLYPIQFAMPFVLVSLWFLTKYFAGIIKDEAFILYGFTGAIAMLLEPRTLVFWAISFVTIGIYNFSQKHIARGFYQLLCIILGTILVFYTAGYFILNMQILSPYLSQAVVYQFTHFAAANNNFVLGLIFQLFVVLAAGLLTGALSFFKLVKNGSDKLIKWLIFLVFLGHLVIALLSQDFQLYHLLSVVPYGLILSAMALSDAYQASLNKSSHRRRQPRKRSTSFFAIYLRKQVYLPLLVLAFGIGQPLIHFALDASNNSSRETIVTYLKKSAKSDQTIYVWDKTAKVYLETGLKSSAQFALPTVHTADKANKKGLEDELLQNEASYVVINKSQTASSTLKKNLKKNYKRVSLSDLKGFSLYQKK